MIPNPYKGAFFVCDGIDGCGKSTQVDLFWEWIHNLYPITDPIGRYIVVEKAKEPNKDGFWGKKIYENLSNPDGLHVTDPKGFQRWYSCDSKIHLRDKIIPRLKTGGVIVSDRFRSSLVYGAQNVRDIEELMRMNEAVIGEDFIWPDVIFIFNVAVEEAMRRLKEKGRALDGLENVKVLHRVCRNYLTFASMYPNCYVIDANRPKNDIFKDVKDIAEKIVVQKGIIKGI